MVRNLDFPRAAAADNHHDKHHDDVNYHHDA
jgi:hypothetical protein